MKIKPRNVGLLISLSFISMIGVGFSAWATGVDEYELNGMLRADAIVSIDEMINFRNGGISMDEITPSGFARDNVVVGASNNINVYLQVDLNRLKLFLTSLQNENAYLNLKVTIGYGEKNSCSIKNLFSSNYFDSAKYIAHYDDEIKTPNTNISLSLNDTFLSSQFKIDNIDTNNETLYIDLCFTMSFSSFSETFYYDFRNAKIYASAQILIGD